jgi:hypothetical protein
MSSNAHQLTNGCLANVMRRSVNRMDANPKCVPLKSVYRMSGKMMGAIRRDVSPRIEFVHRDPTMRSLDGNHWDVWGGDENLRSTANCFYPPKTAPPRQPLPEFSS